MRFGEVMECVPLCPRELEFCVEKPPLWRYFRREGVSHGRHWGSENEAGRIFVRKTSRGTRLLAAHTSIVNGDSLFSTAMDEFGFTGCMRAKGGEDKTEEYEQKLFREGCG